MPQKDGRRIGMYDETQAIKIGKYTICRQDPDGEDKSVWISQEGEEGAEFQDELLEPVIASFFDKYF